MSEDENLRGARYLEMLAASLRSLDVTQLSEWAQALTAVLARGGRLLVAGNGGSAAQAQHLTAELVGRFQKERAPMSALALHAETSSMTGIGNDYGFEEIYARQVRAHGRNGDILLLLSTSGDSENLVRAARTASNAGIDVWSMTGPARNRLARESHRVFAVDAPTSTTVQECHLAAIHLLCQFVDDRLADDTPSFTAYEAPVATISATPRAVSVETSSERHLVIVGEAFLDTDRDGIADRMIVGSAAPIVEDVSTTERPGGAGLAALMAATEPGWRVTLITALGDDRPGQRVRELAAAAGIEVLDLAGRGSTATKSRLLARGRVIARFDETQQIEVNELPAMVSAALQSAQAILVADYGMGLLEHVQLRTLLDEHSDHAPLVWDPHPRGSRPVRGAAVAVPNAAEAALLSEQKSHGELREDAHNGQLLRQRWGLPGLVVTRGAAGALLQPHSGSPLAIPCDEVGAGDACGAGDRFAVSLSVQLGAGTGLDAAVEISVGVAADYVRDGGPVGLDLAVRRSETDPLALVRQVRKTGGRVVATAGCFDVLHYGHIALLRRARSLGDCLIVCLNSDASVRHIKGPNRPIVPAADRAAVLSAVKSVDGVIVFDEHTPHDVLSKIRPDIYVKGGDYKGNDLPERELVESWGGAVVLAPYLNGHSTTSLINTVTGRPNNSDLP